MRPYHAAAANTDRDALLPLRSVRRVTGFFIEYTTLARLLQGGEPVLLGAEEKM